MNEHVSNPEPVGAMPPPGLYENWPGDPGPRPDDRLPFPMKNTERFQFGSPGVIFFFTRRTSAGAFVFEPEDAAAPLVRSSWRLEREFEARLLLRLDRGRAKNAGGETEEVPNVPQQKIDRALPSGEKLKRYVDRVRSYQASSVELGRKPVPISGPREKGARSVPHLPARNLDELLANLAEEFGETPNERPHWKTFAKVLGSVQHLDTVPALVLADGRTLAHHPLRTRGRVYDTACRIIFEGIRRETLGGLQRRIRDRIVEENPKFPEHQRIEKPKIGREALKNILLTFDGIEISKDVHGLRKTRTFYRTTGKLQKPEEPFTRVEFDWHLFDCETRFPRAGKILSALAGKPITRAWLIAGVDVTTGWCVGFAWTVGAVTRSDVMRAYAHICRRKPSYAHFGVSGHWPHGVCKIFAYDHGMANKAKDVVAAVTELGSEIDRDEAGEPRGRPFVERFFGVVEEEFISKLDGWVGTSVATRPDEPAKARELLATDELEARFIRFVVDFHASKCASTRFMSPRAALLDYEKNHPGWAPDTARSEEELDRALRVRAFRKATHEGLRFKHMWYNGLAVRKVRADRHAHSTGDPTVELRIKPDDISDAIVQDTNRLSGGWPSVECQHRGYAPGKSIRLHDIIYAAANASKKADEEITEAKLDRTYTEITRRVLQKALRRGAPRNVSRAAARFAALQGPGGADPVGSAMRRTLTTEEFGAAAHGNPAPLAPEIPGGTAGGPGEFDEAAARRQLAGRHDVGGVPQAQHDHADGGVSAAQIMEEDNDDEY